jgi:hypothetical protein
VVVFHLGDVDLLIGRGRHSGEKGLVEECSRELEGKKRHKYSDYEIPESTHEPDCRGSISNQSSSGEWSRFIFTII